MTDGPTSRDLPAVAVVGVGAIGGTVAAHLASGRAAEVVLCVRSPVVPLSVETPSGLVSAAPRAVTSPDAVGPVQWVLLCTKAHQTESARNWLERLAGPGVVVAVLQNGVEHVERVSPYLAGAEALPVVVSCAADRMGPGRLRQRGEARLTVRDDATGRRFQALAAGSGITVDCTADFTTAAWKKLCANAVGGALTVLTGQPMGVLRRADVAEIARGMARECAQVARAEGARLEADFADALIARMQEGPPDATPSILKDALAGRPLEYDARNAVIARIGARHGIASPLNAMATALMAAASARSAAAGGEVT